MCAAFIRAVSQQTAKPSAAVKIDDARGKAQIPLRRLCDKDADFVVDLLRALLEVKGVDVALYGTPISELESVTCRMRSHSCYLPPDTGERTKFDYSDTNRFVVDLSRT